MKKVIKIVVISFVSLWVLSVVWGVTKYGGWNAYLDHIEKEKAAKSVDKSEDDEDCCCCIPFEGQAGTCMETKKMSKDRCKQKGGTPLLDGNCE
jgi:hypothetical protein